MTILSRQNGQEMGREDSSPDKSVFVDWRRSTNKQFLILKILVAIKRARDSF